jgi:hypothetical protein
MLAGLASQSVACMGLSQQGVSSPGGVPMQSQTTARELMGLDYSRSPPT